jgi:hypothetical protein
VGVFDVVAIVVDDVGGQDDEPADRPIAVLGRDIDRRVADGRRDRRDDWSDRRQRDRQEGGRPGGCESIGPR